MLARDVMTSPAVTTTPDAPITEVIDLMLKHQVSALPVVDAAGDLAGIVSEGDLIQRDEIGTLPHRSWWLSALGTKAQLADDFVKSPEEWQPIPGSLDAIRRLGLEPKSPCLRCFAPPARASGGRRGGGLVYPAAVRQNRL